MKKISSLFITVFFLNFTNAEAKDVLGLNLCGNVSTEDVKNSLNKNQAILDKVEVEEELNEITILTKDYKVADKAAEVSFSIYKGKLYKIRFQDGDIVSDILKSKYGLLRREKVNGVVLEDNFYYNSRDKDIDIFETYGEPNPAFGLPGYHGWHYATYLCKSIDKMRSIDIEKLNNKKQLQKKGASQL